MSYKCATEAMVGETYLTDIPFYNYRWGFKQEYNNYDRPYPLWFDTEDEVIDVHRRVLVKVNVDELIEQIILSPYIEPYALFLIQDMVKQYDIDPNKVVNSSIRFR